MKTIPKEIFDIEAYLNRSEREMVFLYFGSPTCGFCCEPEYKALIVKARENLLPLAKQRKTILRTIGACVDRSINDGISFLQEIGEWDEVVIGNGWNNSAMIEHVWKVDSATGGVPQVVILERTFKHSPQAGHKRQFLDQTYLARMLGKPPLRAWLEAGLPLRPEGAA